MVDFTRYRTIRHERRDRVLTLILNRPEALNAVDGEMHAELTQVFFDAANDPLSDVIVLTGEGKAFSSGGDIRWMQSIIDEGFDLTAREAKRIIVSLLDCEKPIIARINGHATGFGATLALFCDIIIAAETAKIGDPHVQVGFTAGDGGAVIWPQLVGYARAKEYLMTGDLMTAVEAARIGLINHSVPSEELDNRVYGLATRLVEGSQVAIRTTKMSINIGLKQLVASIMDACLAYEALSNSSRDHQEAVSAFRERRKPVFQIESVSVRRVIRTSCRRRRYALGIGPPGPSLNGRRMLLALTGEPMGGERAYQLGFFQELVREEKLLPRVMALANELTRHLRPAFTCKVKRIFVGRANEEMWRDYELDRLWGVDYLQASL
jgi:enoyl-CoA hydratase